MQLLYTAETKRSYKFILATHHQLTYLNPSFLGVQERVELLSSSFAGKKTALSVGHIQAAQSQAPLSGAAVTFSEVKGSLPSQTKTGQHAASQKALGRHPTSSGHNSFTKTKENKEPLSPSLPSILQILQGNKTMLRIANFQPRHSIRLARIALSRRSETKFLLKENREGADRITRDVLFPKHDLPES